MSLVSLLFGAATPENPRFSLNSPDAWDSLFGGTQSSSGLAVNRETALTYSPFWRAVNLISGDYCRLHLHVYKRIETEDGEGKERATEHPAYRLLRSAPNDMQTAPEWRQQMAFHMLLGDGYSYIYRDGAGQPLELWPLNPDVTHPVRENGKTLYVTQVDGGEKRKLPAADVLHFMGLSFDGICGYRTTEKGRETLGLGMGAHRFTTVFFKNSSRPPMVLETPQKLGPQESDTLRKQWADMQGGLDNQHKTAVLHSGVSAKTIGINPKDSLLDGILKMSIIEVANLFGIPPHKLGDDSHTSDNSLESEEQSYLDGIDPGLVKFESQCANKLLSEAEKKDDSHLIEFNRAAFLRANMQARAEYFSKATGGIPWMTRNEVRAVENMNPKPDEEFIDPQNIVGKPPADQQPQPLKTEPPQPQPPAEPDGMADARRKIALDTIWRMTRRVCSAVQRAGKWTEKIEADNAENFTDALEPVAALFGKGPGLGVKIFAMLKSSLIERAEDLPAKIAALEGTFPQITLARLEGKCEP